MKRIAIKPENYINTEDLDLEYKIESSPETIDRSFQFEAREPEIQRVEVVKRRAMPRMEEAKLRPIKRDTPEVFGNLFDRVEFLKERINEIEESAATRNAMHNEFLKEIDADIAHKEDMATHISDMDERRNFTLDISILRREKRQENVQFWRDILELKTELRELSERLQTENKILSAFKDIEGEMNDRQ